MFISTPSGTLEMQVLPAAGSPSFAPLSVTLREKLVPFVALSLTLKLAPPNAAQCVVVEPGQRSTAPALFATFVKRSLPTESQKSEPVFVPAAPPFVFGSVPGWQLSTTSFGGFGSSPLAGAVPTTHFDSFAVVVAALPAATTPVPVASGSIAKPVGATVSVIVYVRAVPSELRHTLLIRYWPLSGSASEPRLSRIGDSMAETAGWMQSNGLGVTVKLAPV